VGKLSVGKLNKDQVIASERSERSNPASKFVRLLRPLGLAMTCCLIVILFVPVLAEAKVSKEFRALFEETFVPATPDEGFVTAQAELQIDKVKTFVVIEKDNIIPAGRAFYMFTAQEYEYRGAVVDGEQVKTRHGKIYTFLPKGAIMALVSDVYSGRHIYLKLLSLRSIPSTLHPKMEETRAAVMLGFKFDKSILKNEEMDKVRSAIDGWVKPFKTYTEAFTYSEKIKIPSEVIPPK